jgi:hypothetical protein
VKNLGARQLGGRGSDDDILDADLMNDLSRLLLNGVFSG